MSFISSPGSGGSIFAEEYTLATRPSAATAGAGARIVITDALGVGGQTNTLWYSTGSVWAPFSEVLIASSDTVFTGDGNIGDVEQYLAGLEIYAGALNEASRFRLEFGVSFSINSTGIKNLRLGPNGDITDGILLALDTGTFNQPVGATLTFFNVGAASTRPIGKWITCGPSFGASDFFGSSGAATQPLLSASVDFDTNFYLAPTLYNMFNSSGAAPILGAMRLWSLPCL